MSKSGLPAWRVCLLPLLVPRPCRLPAVSVRSHLCFPAPAAGKGRQFNCLIESMSKSGFGCARFACLPAQLLGAGAGLAVCAGLAWLAGVRWRGWGREALHSCTPQRIPPSTQETGCARGCRLQPAYNQSSRLPVGLQEPPNEWLFCRRSPAFPHPHLLPCPRRCPCPCLQRGVPAGGG